MTNNVTMIVGKPDIDQVLPEHQIGRMKTKGEWFNHHPVKSHKPFVSLIGIKRSITMMWNTTNKEYVAVITPLSDGTFQADLARLI